MTGLQVDCQSKEQFDFLFLKSQAGTNLRRVDRVDGTHGWEVRIVRKDLKTTKLFSDGPHGGAEGAMVAAQAWRDQKIGFHPRSTPKLSARVLEIYRYEHPMRDVNQPRMSAFWAAAWIDARGHTWTRKYSVEFWGEDMAKNKAEAMHEVQLRGVAALRSRAPIEQADGS